MTSIAAPTRPPCPGRPTPRRTRWRAATLLLTIGLASVAARAAGWTDALRAEVERIDRATPGAVGVYVKRLDDGTQMSYAADRKWYLASAVKLPVAIALLQEVEAGRLRLDQPLVLQDSDRIEGSGNVVWQPSGRSFPLDQLMRRMLMDSDNTASNMLIRTMGIEVLNRRVQDLLGAGSVGRITDLAAVRYDVYAELHPSARGLPNLEMVKIAAAPIGPRRVEALRRALKVEPAGLRVPTMEAAYARYYARDLNTATLAAYGGMLERLVRGGLVSPEHLKRLFKDLKYDTYDAYRLEAGLPRSVRFIHKTGTQFERACHMGVIEPQDGGRRAIVVAACAEGLDEHEAAGRLFEQVGRAITKTLLQGAPGG